MNKRAITIQAVIIGIICIAVFVLIVIAMIKLFPAGSKRFFDMLNSINPFRNINLNNQNNLPRL